MGTLQDWAPQEFMQSYDDCKAYRFRNIEVVEDHSFHTKPWPGPHKNVANWCILANGYAVGWNENPGRGWSFPVFSLRRHGEA